MTMQWRKAPRFRSAAPSAIALSLLVATCASSPATEAQDSVKVVLAIGASKRVPDTNLTVKVEEIVADSRCPTGVNCVWAGDAAIKIQMNVTNTPPATAILHTNLASREALHGGWRIQLMEVSPVPSAEGRPKSEDYRVTLQIDRKERP